MVRKSVALFARMRQALTAFPSRSLPFFLSRNTSSSFYSRGISAAFLSQSISSSFPSKSISAAFLSNNILSFFLARNISSAVLKNTPPVGSFHTTPTLQKSSEGRLYGKVALITGSCGGVAEGIAHELASRGCQIILTTGVNCDSDAQRIIDELWDEYDVEPLHVSVDLSKRSAIEKLCKDIYNVHPEGVDILVNNAGFHHMCPLLEFPDEWWEEMISVLLSAPFYLSQILGDSMKHKGWGRIINVTSAHGNISAVPPKRTAYGLAKTSLVGLSKVTAKEMSPYGVTCNTLCLGYVNTPTLQGKVQALQQELDCTFEEAKHQFLGKRDITKAPTEIPHLAQMVAFLCSDASAHITGASLHIDGGMRF